MNTSYLYSFFGFIFLLGCSDPQPVAVVGSACASSTHNLEQNRFAETDGSIGALLLTQYNSLEELKAVVDIDFNIAPNSAQKGMFDRPEVRITHSSGGEKVTSILSDGVNEGDFNLARDGDLWDRIRLATKTPFAVMNRKDLVSIELLGRRRYEMFGEGDIAFYDLAEQMADNIKKDSIRSFSERDLSEKGYLNTFNHITAQAIMTAAYSEKLADFVADVHERYTMPELITGEFTEEQLSDLEKGPVDNYVDMINNEWGQELGKRFRIKYKINYSTIWTPEILTSLLNDIQKHCGYALNIRFQPFRETDEMVIRFANKINKTNAGVTEYIQYYFDRIKLNMDC